MQSNNKRIAKNTLALSGRLLLTIIVGVYASRVLLQNLGVTDYGVNDVVSGVVTMFGLLNVSLINSIQRYLNFYIGRDDNEKVCEVFSIGIQIFIAVACGIALLGETVGLWLLNTQLDIPEERLYAANWVFQFAIISTVIEFICVPYNSLMIAYEHLTTFAYVEIVRSLMMFSFAMAIPYLPTDGLIGYTFLVMLLMIGIRFFYAYYCKRNFQQVRYTKVSNLKLLKEMSVFSGWSMLEVVAYLTYTHGLTILLNIMFGPVVNTAKALANQVQLTLLTFSTNFMMATKPQIVKYYAEGNYAEMMKLVMMSTKISYGIMVVVCMPFLIRTDCILNIWLTTVPEHTGVFMQLMLLTAIISSLSQPAISAIQATGKIKAYQIAEALVLLMILPASYVVIKLSNNPTDVFKVTMLFFILVQCVRVYYLWKYFRVSYLQYFSDIVLRLLVYMSLTYFVCDYISAAISQSFIGTVAVALFGVVVTVVVFVPICLSRSEMMYVLEKARTMIKRGGA